MQFYEQAWFWTGLFGIIGSLGGIIVRDWLTAKSQIRLERLKLHELGVLHAYSNLYSFISSAYALFPPNDPHQDFRELMRYSYLKRVKPNMISYSAGIRKKLQTLESQYDCLSDPDLIPEKPFEEFFKKDFVRILKELENLVTKQTDRIFHLES